MLSQKQWILACTECEIKLNLQNNTIRSLVDPKGKIINKCYESLQELIQFSEQLQIKFPIINEVNEFINDHSGHPLRIAPIIDDEFDEYEEIQCHIQNKKQNLQAQCNDCNQSLVFNASLIQNKEINKDLAIKELELFNQLFELYHELGCWINNNQHMVELERFLPFFKKHAGHKLQLIST